MQLAITVFDPAAVAAEFDLAGFLALAQRRGHRCSVYSACAATVPADVANWQQLRVKGRGAERQRVAFAAQVRELLGLCRPDAVLGLDPLPGLDALLLSDLPRPDRRPRGWAGRLGGAGRELLALETQALSAQPAPLLLYLSELQQARFNTCYGPPGSDQLLLPPGVAREIPVEQSRELRRALRQGWELAEGELVLLFAGSDFERQGLARAIRALAHAREVQPHQQMRLVVAGAGRYRSYHHLARKLGVRDALHFLSGKQPLDGLLHAADVLVHPAQPEAAGRVLLQALVAQLPVIASETSGYARHIAAARAGLVLRAPFQQEDLDHAVLRCIDGFYRSQCRETGQAYLRLTDLYSQAEVLVEALERRLPAAPGVGASRHS